MHFSPSGTELASLLLKVLTPSAVGDVPSVPRMGIFLFCAFRTSSPQGSQALVMNKEHLNFIERIQGSAWGNKGRPRDAADGAKGDAATQYNSSSARVDVWEQNLSS